eukprot:Em0004g1026a
MDRSVANVSCNLSYVEDPQVFVANLAEENLSESVLISPQSVYLNLRTGQQAVFNVSVKTSRTYPLDFYFMMDLTGSLKYDVEQVQASGTDIANVLKNISQNYKVGFGSFVAKPVPPFVVAIPYRQPDGTCYNKEGSCIEPYAYRHILQMTNVTETFLNILNTKLNLSSAAENPQSGTDALAQAILCKNIVGWRDEAFRMLMLISDNAVHFAGDGKAGGVVVPFDGKCHLEWNNATGTYDYLPKYSALYDFPSVAQLKSLIADTGVSVIFGIAGANTNNTTPGTFFFPDVYKAIAKVMDIPESSVAILSKNSTNILQVINDQYLKAIGLIKFSVPAVNGVNITVQPIMGCNSSLPSGCNDVSLEKEVVFRVTVGLTHCPSTPQNNIVVPLRIPALAQQITIEINPNCQCACESKPAANSLLCNNQTLVCGLCHCEAGRYGELCQCRGATACPVGLQGLTCSGSAGICKPDNCYKCQCLGSYFGDACECDRLKCLTSSSGICSGESNGLCSCSGSNVACSCKRAPLSNITYMGSACNCDPDDCVNRETNATCSDPAIGSTLCHCTGSPCSCSCSCPANTVPPLCEPQALVNSRCVAAKQCAECGSTKALSECTECVFINSDSQAYKCGVIVSGTCTDSHTYYVDTQKRVYLKRNTVTCDPGPGPIIIVFSVLGAIIALGLIFLIIAKIILICLDQVEYKKFTSQLEGADWAPRNNPLYMSPEQNYTNVLYRKRSYRGSK